MNAPLDFRSLRPVELCRVLNSTPVGTVLSERQLHRDRTAAGYRISPDGEHVDLFKYAAWLQAQVAQAPESPDLGAAYARKKERVHERDQRLSRSGRDIGELPPVENPERRAAGLASLQRATPHTHDRHAPD